MTHMCKVQSNVTILGRIVAHWHVQRFAEHSGNKERLCAPKFGSRAEDNA